MGRFEDFGLQKPDHAFFETHPIVNQQLVYYVGHGDITPKPDVDHFDAAGAVFADGTRADVDLVVFATGYLAVFPFLADQDALDAAADAATGAADGLPTSPTLWLSGLIQPDSGQWTIAHWQGMAIAQFLNLRRGSAGRGPDPCPAQRPPRAAVHRGAHYRTRPGTTTRSPIRTTSQRCRTSWQRWPREPRAEGPAPQGVGVADKPVHLEVFREEALARQATAVVPARPGPRCLVLPRLWQAAAADRGYSSYALSYRGHGGSGGQRELRRATLRDYVHDVLQVIVTLPQPPVIVAHSLGTLVAQRVLQRCARAGVLMTPIPRRASRPPPCRACAASRWTSPARYSVRHCG